MFAPSPERCLNAALLGQLLYGCVTLPHHFSGELPKSSYIHCRSLALKAHPCIGLCVLLPHDESRLGLGVKEAISHTPGSHDLAWLHAARSGFPLWKSLPNTSWLECARRLRSITTTNHDTPVHTQAIHCKSVNALPNSTPGRADLRSAAQDDQAATLANSSFHSWSIVEALLQSSSR